MKLDDLAPAVQTLHDSVVRFRPLKIVMEEILSEFDVNEAAVRARFERAYHITPEELATRHTEDHSIKSYIDQFRLAHGGYHPSRLAHLGKRFYIVGDDRKTGLERKQWCRFLLSHGLMVVVVDELTKKQSLVYDREIIDDIAWQIGWKRWADWPEQGPKPSRMFPADVPT